MKNMTWGSHGPATPSPRYPFFDSMKEKAPASGGLKLWSATAAVVLSISCCLVAPASTHSVRLRYRGSSVRAAGGLKQFGARSLGFQNSASSKPAAQERSTKQTKPLLPLTAVS